MDLEALGVERESKDLYLLLAPLHEAAADEIAQNQVAQNRTAFREVGEVTAGLRRLGELGLAVDTGTGLWQAVPLPQAVKVLRSKQLAELDQAMINADNLYSTVLASRRSHSDEVRTFAGRDAINVVMNDLCGSARESLWAFDKPPYVNTRAATKEWLQANSPEWQALERGVEIRSVYHPGFSQERMKEFRLFATAGEHARIGLVPMKLILVDKTSALIPAMSSYGTGHELRATLISHESLVEALCWVFETAWERAVALTAMDVGLGEDPRRDQLIPLLMTGSSDIDIAEEVGVTERTVRRWVADLMSEHEVTTRLQLGAALSRSEDLQQEYPGEAS